MTSAAAMLSRSPVRACIDLARAGNFPSVASNVLAALVLSAKGGPVWPAGGLLGLAICAGCLIYAGGATFNDVADAKFDAVNRPERALPRQIVSRFTAGGIGAIELVAGLVLLVGAGAKATWAAALAATIIGYDLVHKRWSGSVLLMAGCRVLLALTVSTLPLHAPGASFWGWVGALFCYIVTLSLIARREYRAPPPSLPSLPSPPFADLRGETEADRAPRYNPKRGPSVARLLAFIPLIDAMALLLVGAWLPALACAAGVPFGRWAQRLAAST